MTVLFCALPLRYCDIGVERAFSRGKWLTGENRDLSNPVMNGEATIADSYSKEDDDAAIEIAQRLWANLFDSSRSASSCWPRVDKGVPKRSREESSEAAWVTRRRSEVDQLMSRARRRC